LPQPPATWVTRSFCAVSGASGIACADEAMPRPAPARAAAAAIARSVFMFPPRIVAAANLVPANELAMNVAAD
jgi:hypothetical protein